MRLVATEYLSLDGVFEEPGRWSSQWFDEEAGQFKFDELRASDALLMGRRTYQGFASAWPAMEGTGEFGEKMNSMPKYVVSSTLEKVEWSGSKLIRANVAEEVAKLKKQSGGDLLLSGSGMLFNDMMRENLIDLYRLMIHPVVLGTGARLFTEDSTKRALELTEVKRFASGIVVLEFIPAK